MLGEHHNLVHEFPEFREQIHELKVSDGHFARLFDEYHRLDRRIRRIEQQVEAVPEEYAESLKKRRLWLKDELYRMLRQAAA